MQGLVVDRPYIDQILSGLKTWEMRTTRTTKRGQIALIQKGSGTVTGVTTVTGSMGPLSKDEVARQTARHLLSAEQLSHPDIARWNHAWVLENSRRLRVPVGYKHPPGAVIWVNLSEEVARQIATQVC